MSETETPTPAPVDTTDRTLEQLRAMAAAESMRRGSPRPIWTATASRADLLAFLRPLLRGGRVF
jgi:hypothetical protein